MGIEFAIRDGNGAPKWVRKPILQATPGTLPRSIKTVPPFTEKDEPQGELIPLKMPKTGNRPQRPEMKLRDERKMRKSEMNQPATGRISRIAGMVPQNTARGLLMSPSPAKTPDGTHRWRKRQKQREKRTEDRARIQSNEEEIHRRMPQVCTIDFCEQDAIGNVDQKDLGGAVLWKDASDLSWVDVEEMKLIGLLDHKQH